MAGNSKQQAGLEVFLDLHRRRDCCNLFLLRHHQMKPTINILVVDDDVAIAKSFSRLVRILFPLSTIVESKTSVLDAITEIASAGPFDLVITDCHMPDGGGAAVITAARLRCANTHIKTKTILMSGEAGEEEIKKIEPDLFLQKPISIDKLKVSIVQLVPGIVRH